MPFNAFFNALALAFRPYNVAPAFSHSLDKNLPILQKVLSGIFPLNNFASRLETVVTRDALRTMEVYYYATRTETITLPKAQGANSFVFVYDSKFLLKLTPAGTPVFTHPVITPPLLAHFPNLEIYEYTPSAPFIPTAESWERFIECVCTTLVALRRAGIAHCDIKIENLLFKEDGSFYVCDFGSHLPLIKTVQTHLSSVDCIPSCQVLEKASSPRGLGNAILDFRGFAVVLHELLFGAYKGLYSTEFEEHVASTEFYDMMHTTWRSLGVAPSKIERWMRIVYTLLGDTADKSFKSYSALLYSSDDDTLLRETTSNPALEPYGEPVLLPMHSSMWMSTESSLFNRTVMI